MARHLLELAHHLGDLVAVAGALDLREVEREQVAGHQLGQEALGGGDPDLGARMGVDDGVGLARDRRAVGVADRQHLRALGARVPDRLQGVGGLAGLADRDHQRGVVQDRVAVAELAGELDLDGDAAPVLDGVLGDHAGVEGGAGRDDDDLVDVAQLLVGQAHLVEVQRPLPRTPPQQRVGDGARLLVDLLAHEPVVAVLLGRGEVPVDVVGPALGGRAVEAGDADALGGQRDDLVLVELERLAGVLDEGGDVGAEEVLALAEADHERAVAARGHHQAGGLAVDGHEGEGALEPAAHPLHGGGQVDPRDHLQLQQVRDDLGVGLGDQLVAVVLEARAQVVEVLDDAVVHDRHPPGRAGGRVGVDVVGRTVGGPAGVPDAGRRGRQRVGVDDLLEVGQLARLLAGHQGAAVDQGDAGRVVAAVLQAPQPLDDDQLGGALPDVPHDPAHGR